MNFTIALFIIVAILFVILVFMIRNRGKLKRTLKERDETIDAMKTNLKVLKTGETNSLRASTTRDIIKEKMRVAEDDKELDKVCDFVVTTLVDGVRNMPEFQ